MQLTEEGGKRRYAAAREEPTNMPAALAAAAAAGATAYNSHPYTARQPGEGGKVSPQAHPEKVKLALLEITHDHEHGLLW